MEIKLDAPTKGINELTLLSSEVRLKGRPKICSDCGLCDSELKHIVPHHVYEALQPYAEAYKDVYGKELLPRK